MTKYNKQIRRFFKKGKSGGFLLPSWRIFCNDKKNNGNISVFIRATKNNSPTGDSGATSLPPIGSAFLYVEAISNNHGHDRVFVSWERTDLIQITKITFYFNRFSI